MTIIKSISNTENLISGLTPTAAGWGTQPATNAEISNELGYSLSTPGVQTNSVDSTLVYDLGASKRITVNVIRGTVGTTSAYKIELSDDNSNWYLAAILANNTTAMKHLAGSGKGRYVRITFLLTNPGNTISDLSIRVYQI